MCLSVVPENVRVISTIVLPTLRKFFRSNAEGEDTNFRTCVSILAYQQLIFFSARLRHVCRRCFGGGTGAIGVARPTWTAPRQRRYPIIGVKCCGGGSSGCIGTRGGAPVGLPPCWRTCRVSSFGLAPYFEVRSSLGFFGAFGAFVSFGATNFLNASSLPADGDETSRPIAPSEELSLSSTSSLARFSVAFSLSSLASAARIAAALAQAWRWHQILSFCALSSSQRLTIACASRRRLTPLGVFEPSVDIGAFGVADGIARRRCLRQNSCKLLL